MISTKLDVVAHHSRVHPNKFNRKSINNKLRLDVHYTANDLNNAGLRKADNQFGVEEACKVTVKYLVVADELVAEA